MKTYTTEERGKAMNKLPKPVSDFAKSQIITNIYVGIAKKHKLNTQEIAQVSMIANVILLGIEPESSLETTIHQTLPELSNQQTNELVADINDRIFKEARRRLAENIVTEDVWDEAELGPKLKEEDYKRLREQEKEDNDNPLSNEELHRIAEAEKMARKAEEEAQERRWEEEAAKKKTEETSSISPLPNSTGAEPAPEEFRTSPRISIAEQKLRAAENIAPVQTIVQKMPAKAVESKVETLESRVKNLESQVEVEKKPINVERPSTQEQSLLPPRPRNDVDPYREMPD